MITHAFLSHIHAIAPTAESVPLIGEFPCIKLFEAVFDIELPVDFRIGEEAQCMTAALFHSWDDAFL